MNHWHSIPQCRRWREILGSPWANEYEPNEKGFLELKKDLSRIEKKYGNKLSDFKKTKLIQLTNRYEDGVKELWQLIVAHHRRYAGGRGLPY